MYRQLEGGERGGREKDSHQPALSPRERALAVITAIDGKLVVLTFGKPETL